MSAEAFRGTIEQPSDRVIVALDNMDWDVAGAVMGEVGPHVGMAKANSIAQKYGWEHAVDTIANLGAFTMADTKFHDIPKTVELQVQEVTEVGASLITVHASGGEEMLQAAVAGSQEGKTYIESGLANKLKFGPKNFPRLGGVLGITVLTSLDNEDCQSIYGSDSQTKVLEFAKMAEAAGVDGIVCSGEELKAVRSDESLDGLLTVVPGITPEWAKKAGDQKRIVTPSEAVQSGADYIVVGRAITRPPEDISRVEAAQRIAEELKAA
jgi:orotidine-5'-phosphate decarboxylase